MTERGQCMLKHTACRSRKLSAKSIDKNFRLAQQCVESFREWVSMVKQLYPSRTSPSAIQSV
ncbi:unnamed protein product [Staurois parvus]|uniref:Uncharacterized protein n=1 Tax=Staurois parvus TaxID=386267 RepID=A0ABN9FTL3_9NEOB|nr:unnamed protein product [Staurois parvus]